MCPCVPNVSQTEYLLILIQSDFAQCMLDYSFVISFDAINYYVYAPNCIEQLVHVIIACAWIGYIGCFK